jgi:hypothetical protein
MHQPRLLKVSTKGYKFEMSKFLLISTDCAVLDEVNFQENR